MSKKMKALIALILVIIIVLAIYSYWQYEKYYPSTDNAYVKANLVNIAPQVSGEIKNTTIMDNQTVKKGQLLFSIDSKSFVYAVEQAQAKLKQTRQNIIAQLDGVNTAKALARESEAEEIVAQKNYNRYIYLANKGQASTSEADAVTSKLNAAKAALTASETEVQKAKAELGSTNKDNADLEIATANLRTALLNLKHTKIYAPATGIIANFTLRTGDVVNANETLFSIIENNHWWLNANYKETDLTYIKPGQAATITLDLYPNHTFHGSVESISDGSGATFSILPPENATGNWVKVTQRFTVKILINDPSPKFPLRVGASANVTVDARK